MDAIKGKQIGAGAKGGGKDVTLVNCQHFKFCDGS
jgi:hypothetical protein